MAKAIFTVRTNLEDAAAYLFDYESQANKAFGDFKRKIDKRKGTFELLVSKTVIIHGKHSNFQQDCEFSNTLSLHVIDADTIMLQIKPPLERMSGGGIRSIFSIYRISRIGKIDAKEKTAVRLRRVGKKETKIEFVTELDFGMPVGKAVIKSQLESQLRGCSAMANYFLNLLGGDSLDDINEKDGIALGGFLYEGGKDAVKRTINESGILQSLRTEFPWFEMMMEEVLKNKLRPASSSIETKAECVSNEEARRIGKSLAVSLATNITAPGGVDE